MFNVESRPLMSRQEMLLSGMEAAPNAEAYVNAHATQAFDRTTTGRGMEEYSIMRAEKNEGTWDESYAQGQATQEFTGPFAGMQPTEHKHAMSETEWKKSEYYVPTIKYRPDMTLTRARIQKENYDQRRYLEHIVSKGDDAFGIGMKVLGFGASLVGSLPDPINIIPFSGGMKAASVGKGAFKGAIEGAAGNAAVDALVLPDLANKGEDVGFADALLDTAFGAVLGGALGGLGGYLGKRRADAVEQQVAEFHRSRGASFGQDIVQGQVAFTPRTTNEASAAPFLPRNDMADLVRAGVSQQDRHNFKLGMEKALADFHADRPVDVSGILRESEALGRAYDTVRQDPLGGPADEVLASLHPEDIDAVLVHRGPAVMRDGEIVVQGAPLKRAGLAKRGFGLVKIVFAHGEEGNKTPTMPLVTREDIISLPHTLRDYLPAETEGTTTVWRIPREDGKHLNIVVGGGQDKDATRLVTMFVDAKNTRLSQKKNRPSSLTLPGERSQDTSQGISVFTPDGSDGGKSPTESPLPSARLGEGYVSGGIDVLSTPDSLRGKSRHTSESSPSVSAQGRDTSQGINTFTTDGQNGVSGRTIDAPRADVNYAVERSDAFPPAPALREETLALHEEFGVDMQTGMLPEEAVVNELDAAGRVAPEDRDALLNAQEQARRAPEYDDIGQSIIPCILEVPDGK